MGEEYFEEVEDMIARAEALAVNTAVSWNEWGHSRYCSSEVFRCATQFLRRLVELSVEVGDPIDVPDIFSCSNGEATETYLEWNFPHYSFLLWFSGPRDPVVYSGGRDKSSYDCGEIAPGGVEEALARWQAVARINQE